MSDEYPAGWYDDPKTEGQERYWDGTGWTHDVRQTFAEGWYDDPDRFGFQRYWDGGAWTDDRRPLTRLDDVFVAPTIRKKEWRLLVTGEELHWGEDSIRWADVTSFDSVTIYNQGRLGLYRVNASGNGSKFLMELPPDQPGETRVADAFATVIDQAHRIITPRILAPIWKQVDAGEVVEYQKVAFSPRGFAKGSKNDPIPWSEYGGWRHSGGYFQVDRKVGDKLKRVVNVHTSQLERWVLVALLEDYTRRFSGA